MAKPSCGSRVYEFVYLCFCDKCRLASRMRRAAQLLLNAVNRKIGLNVLNDGDIIFCDAVRVEFEAEGWFLI